MTFSKHNLRTITIGPENLAIGRSLLSLLVIATMLIVSVNAGASDKKREATLGYTVSAGDAHDTQTIDLGYQHEGGVLVKFSEKSNLSWALGLDLSWNATETDQDDTVTQAADFFPIVLSWEPVADLSFDLSGGLTYLITDELAISTGKRTKSSDLAYVYKLGFEYQTGLPCLSVGADYKIRTGDVFGGRLSYEWVPAVTFNFMESCSRS